MSVKGIDLKSYILGRVAGSSGGGGGGGSAGNIISGTFTPSAEGVESIDTHYTGNGYPIMVVIAVDGGVLSDNWLNNAKKYTIAHTAIFKSVYNSTPQYSGDVNNYEDRCDETTLLATSDSGTAFNGQGAMNSPLFNSSDPAHDGMHHCLTIANKSTIKYYATNTSGQYGYMVNMPYRYWVTYSK